MIHFGGKTKESTHGTAIAKFAEYRRPYTSQGQQSLKKAAQRQQHYSCEFIFLEDVEHELEQGTNLLASAGRGGRLYSARWMLSHHLCSTRRIPISPPLLIPTRSPPNPKPQNSIPSSSTSKETARYLSQRRENADMGLHACWLRCASRIDKWDLAIKYFDVYIEVLPSMMSLGVLFGSGRVETSAHVWCLSSFW
jgi:hypothetical protein